MGKAGSFLYSSKDESYLVAGVTCLPTGGPWKRCSPRAQTLVQRRWPDFESSASFLHFVSNALSCLSMALASLLCALWGEAQERGGGERTLQK